jgi:hypothetical protein
MWKVVYVTYKMDYLDFEFEDETSKEGCGKH